jgi:hypothetical protein
VELGTEGREVAARHVVGAKAHFGKGLIGAAVEQDGVIAHVHVTVIVDPALLDRVKAGQERRGIGHGEGLLKGTAATSF